MDLNYEQLFDLILSWCVNSVLYYSGLCKKLIGNDLKIYERDACSSEI